MFMMQTPIEPGQGHYVEDYSKVSETGKSTVPLRRPPSLRSYHGWHRQTTAGGRGSVYPTPKDCSGSLVEFKMRLFLIM